MSIETQLGDHLAKIGTAPFLFVGSGLSRRYIGLEAWDALLRKFSQGLPKPYTYYQAQAQRDLPKTATLLCEAFYDIWWNNTQYEASRTAFSERLNDTASPMKYEISQYMATKKYVPGENEANDVEVELLKTVTIDGIITTNWDTVLESFFPEFEVYIGQDQVLFSTPQGIAEIYKIHGCSTEPNSLVLTADDYGDFNNRNPYLAAKLLTIFVEHPVIFLGYSLSDPHLMEILKQIASCLTNTNIHKLKDRLLFLERDSAGKGDSFETSVTQVGGFSLPITVIRTNDFTQVYKPLCTAKRRFPARLLRKMKEHVYELVKENDPKGKLAVLDIEQAEEFDDLEVVYGVGVSKLGQRGYSPISRIDLLKDVVATKSVYDAKRIVTETLPNLIGRAKFVPIFRYLREAGLYGQDEKLIEAGLHERTIRAANCVADNYYPPLHYQNQKAEVQGLGSVEAVLIFYGYNAFYYLPLLRKDQVNVADLHKYIVSNLNLMSDRAVNTQTYFRGLICFYDWVAYGPK